MKTTGELQQVHDFWRVEPCGVHFVTDFRDRRDFFAKSREHRYRALWYIPRLVPFNEASGKSLLEIGCGNGADGVMFASHGAQYTGVDLTQTAVDATREHFQVLGLEGRFQTEDAERLSFPDASFDVVYSLGVLHHTPNTRRAIEEVYRVLKPNGKAIIMLYHKTSFNYYLRILGYMRLRVLFRILSRLGRWDSDRQKLAGKSMLELRGNQSGLVWEAHYKHFLERGWNYLAASNFVHHCTDGPECPIAHVFTRSSARAAFSMFRAVELKVGHLPLRQYLGKWVPFSMESLAASRFGWALMIYATKGPPE